MKREEQLFPSKLTFLGEQDGISERKLKTRLADFFSELSYVLRAYLVRVDYGNPNEFNVALCIRAEKKSLPEINNGINMIFSELFRTDEHLDVLFLTEEKEVALSKVCPSFFKKELDVNP